MRVKEPQKPKPNESEDDLPPAEAIETDPAVERGERIHTSKQIARGGKEQGDVPGATEQPVESE